MLFAMLCFSPCKSSTEDIKNNDYLKMNYNGVVISDTWFLRWIVINKQIHKWYIIMQNRNTGNNEKIWFGK